MAKCAKCGTPVTQYASKGLCRDCKRIKPKKPKPERKRKYCVKCNEELGPRIRLDTCPKCRLPRTAPKADGLKCEVCGKQLSPQAKRPYCQAHRADDPEHLARKDAMFNRIWAGSSNEDK